ncbi:penicillin-binding protein 2 [uncultured Eubacterium sp.]|uniref:peptidoglycan D,D-transpeptidase FtsI family protein n=1 Tax=Eubacterium sp. TaxID=142586 RepID=UPI00326771D2
MVENRRRPARRSYKRAEFNKGMQKKLAIVFVLIILALFALCIRIGYLTKAKGDEYSIKVLAQQGYTSKTLPYKRGDILDRNGNVLATSVKVYNLVIDSKVILSNKKYLEPTVNVLTRYFDLNKDELTKGIKERKDNSYWVVLKQLEYKDIEGYKDYINKEEPSKEEAKEISYVKGVWFEEEYKRMYPYNSLACSTLGFVNKDGSANIGIESSYNDVLSGLNGREYGYVNSDNSMETVIKDPTNGDTVVSTIDMNIQRIVQKAIKKYMKKYQPKRLAAVIADPNTGEILAMADNTTFNLNEPWDLSFKYTEQEQENLSEKEISDALNSRWKNFCVSDSFEPGSTIKPFTIAAAYEEGKTTRNSTYFCDGYEVVGGFTIRCHDVSGHGTITTKQALAYSCNDALMRIGFDLGAKKLVEYQRRFGFGAKTGIDLPSETRGLVYDSNMGASSIATNSFGQNINVNMIQMVAGFSSLVNGGNYYEPHVVKEVVSEDGELIDNYSKTLVKETVTDKTSDFIKEALRAVVTDGTGKTAAIPGYTIGGKTGTAEKHYTDGKTGRIPGEYIVSFLGCAPVENPEVVCYTIMDSPKEDTQSTAFSTEFWTYIMKQVLPYMGVSQTEDAGKDKDITNTKKSDIKDNYSQGITQEDMPVETQTENQNDYTGEE